MSDIQCAVPASPLSQWCAYCPSTAASALYWLHGESRWKLCAELGRCALPEAAPAAYISALQEAGAKLAAIVTSTLPKADSHAD